MPVSASYRPRPVIHELGSELCDEVRAATFPEHTLRFRNTRWAQRVGLGELTNAEWEDAFARFVPLPDNQPEPLALRYHGHQFRSYNHELGDGRGFLFAQLEDDAGRLLDLATKGSGQTPWSRQGDGRLTLKGGVREVLATELLEALGVYTSKSFSLYETGESLQRSDEPSPTRSSVLVRLGHSHLRFGTFQRLAFLRKVDDLRRLVQYCLDHYCPELCHFGDRAVAAFFRLVVERSARLCAQWMVAGFVHGVLNTDNLNITGESFDYGPYRFLPVLDPGFTAAYFDRSGLYCYARQPEAVSWNLARLADALSLIESHTRLEPALRSFGASFASALDLELARRLGVVSADRARGRRLREAAFGFLSESRMPFERFFFDWYGGPQAADFALQGSATTHYAGATFENFRACLEEVESAAPRSASYFDGAGPCTLLIDEIEAIWSAIAERDDWQDFESKITAIRSMGQALQATRS